MKNISFLRMYLCSLLSISLWSFIYVLMIYFTPRGHHLNECETYIAICFIVCFLSFLMALVYKLLTLVKKISSVMRDIIFIIFISYSYLPITAFSIFREEMISSFLSMETLSLLLNIKLYLLGVAICPAPFAFVYFINRIKSR